jgi:hypothetical protein
MYPLLLLYICGCKIKSAELIYHSSNRGKTWHNNKEVNLATSHGNFINHKHITHIQAYTLQSQVGPVPLQQGPTSYNFMDVIYKFSYQAKMFVPGRPCLMFVVKAVVYPSEAPFRCYTLALPTKIRLGWKGLPVKNTLAYHENYGPKSFITLAQVSIFTTLYFPCNVCLDTIS